MRSLPKDIRRTAILTTMSPVPDAVAGDGVFSDGTPWHSIRSAAGQYDIYFDPRLIPIGGSVGPTQVSMAYYIFEIISIGMVRVQCLNSTGGAFNRTFDVSMTCLDTRT